MHDCVTNDKKAVKCYVGIDLKKGKERLIESFVPIIDYENIASNDIVELMENGVNLQKIIYELYSY